MLLIHFFTRYWVSKLFLHLSWLIGAIVSLGLLHSSTLHAQNADAPLSANELKKMSMEELMNLEVTSVSRQSEKLTEVASAIQVITAEDIRRSGATNIPEALKLASNLQVAQANSSQWAVSARGFNNVLSNKLLVMIDGRTVYTPLYAGVFWDIQNVILEDVDRIEVISGPGGTMWGSNAVNGVINIITKSAKETQGVFIEAGVGTHMRALANIRYGGKINDELSFRIYGLGFKRDHTYLNDGTNAQDEWHMGQSGVRLDWEPADENLITVQSDLYAGEPNPDGLEPVLARGGNVLARWSRTISKESDFQLQTYYDHTWRDFGNGLKESLRTVDVDWNHRFQIRRSHEIIWGIGLRLMDHEMDNLENFAFLPGRKTLQLYSAFIQDEISLVQNKLFLTIGTKLEHNSYTDLEFQPNGRLAWVPNNKQTIWGSISRAVRIPARIDNDFFVYIAPDVPLIAGSESESEELLAYELGWRSQPTDRLSISLATFYNIYDNIRSAEPGPPITFENGVEGISYGVELSKTYQATDFLRLRGGYMFFKKELSVKSNSNDANRATAESNDPRHQFLLQSSFDLPGRIELGTVLRYVDELPDPHVSDYFGLDVRFAWQLNEIVEINIVGQNLLDERHTEFIPASPSPRKIPRSIYGKITCRF